MKRRFLSYCTSSQKLRNDKGSWNLLDYVYVNNRRCLSTLRPPALSYVHGASSTPLLGLTIGQLLQQRTEATPDKVASIFHKDEVKLTFAELMEKADSLAAGLLTLGCKAGDRVGMWGPNSWEWVVTQYATARAGIILVNINPAYRPSELKYALHKAGVKCLVTAPGFKELNYISTLIEIMPEMALTPHGSMLHSNELPDLNFILTLGSEKFPGSFPFQEILDSATSAQKKEIVGLQDKFQFDEPINIQFTSGTTGSPKGACLTHHNVVNNSYFVGMRCGYHEHESVVCCPVPLYHCFGMVLGSMQSILHGATLVWPSPVFDPKWVISAVETHRCTSLYGVPTMFIDVLNHPSFHTSDLSSLATGIMAGSPCPIETMREVVDVMGIKRMTVAYGSTETSPVSFQSTGHCDLDKRVSTVGKALDHTEAKVIDEAGRVVACGDTGEVCTRGVSTMLCYWGDQEKTQGAISAEGWYHTGDLGVMSDDGYLSIVGRIKDMLIRGGENVYPLEIEQVLYEHPKIMDVQVIGVPDKRLGEQVCAWVNLRAGEVMTEGEVKDFCRGKMSKFKVPHYILFVDEFPKTVTGKIQKFVMRQESTKILGLE